MNSKKKAPAAQQLIDSLLDELPLLSKKKPVKGTAMPSRSLIQPGPRELVFTPGTSSSGEIILDDGQHITIRDEDTTVPKDLQLGVKGLGSSKPKASVQGKSAPASIASPKKTNDQLLAQFRKNLDRDTDDSIIFDGELGGEGTATMLHKSGDADNGGRGKLSLETDPGDPLFAKTKANVIDITSSVSKPDSLHIHSLHAIRDGRAEPSVDQLVEAMELTNPAFKKQNRALPKSESTPRSEIKDAPQVMDNESHEDLVHKVVSHSPPIIQNLEIDLDLEVDETIYAPDDEELPAIPNQAAGPVRGDVAPANGHVASTSVMDDERTQALAPEVVASYGAPEPEVRHEIRPESQPERQHETHHEPQRIETLPPEKILQSLLVADQAVKASPELAPQRKTSKGSGMSRDLLYKELLAFESGRAVLGKVLAKVRGSGASEKNVAKAKIVGKVKDPAPALDSNLKSPASAPAEGSAHWMLQPTEQHDTPERLELPVVQGGDAEENTLPLINRDPVNSQTGDPLRSDRDHEDDQLEAPPRTTSGLRWTQQSADDASDVSPDPTLSRAEISQPGPLDTVDRMMATQIRPGAARARAQQEQFASQGKENASAARPSGNYGIPTFHSAEASLKQSESLRIAQTRISDLEQELERLRRENEKLASAGETLRRHSDELRARAENAEQERRESERIRDEERKVMRGQMSQKDRENIESRQRLEEAEGRLESNFKKIRVRERELEHRLEIMKMESATLVSTKDKMILDLKRQLDQLVHENEYGKQKAQEAFNQYKGKQETQRRVVRALRIALTILEGDDESVVPSKKAE